MEVKRQGRGLDVTFPTDADPTRCHGYDATLFDATKITMSILHVDETGL